MTPRDAADELREIYHTDSPIDALRIVDTLLRPAGVEAVIHDRMSHSFPAPSSEPGEVAIAVPAADQARAIEILAEAAADGMLDDSLIVPTAPLTR
jgi:hypothetical protein